MKPFQFLSVSIWGLCFVLLSVTGAACRSPLSGSSIPSLIPDVSEPTFPCQGPALSDSPPWYQTGVSYEVLVRSFQDGDGDGVGDLRGLLSRLDYLNDGNEATTDDLGVTTLWLMPIHPSPSLHGYDVTDYRDVHRDYGTLEDLDDLVAAAKARGIRVILDLVFNHTSHQHPWFVAGKRGAHMPTSDWYVWSSRALPWGQPWDDTTPVWHPARDRSYYGLFSPEMPDLNWRNPDVRREMFDIAQWWVQRGIAGFRLDAARYLIENGSGNGQRDQRLTREIWRELRQALQGRATQDEVLLLGEIWSDTATSASYLSELQMVFGFERAFGLRQALKQGERAPLKTRLCKELAALRFAAASESGQPRTPAFASFLSNHDMARFASAISDDPRVLRLAATLLLTLPGTPYLYYGEEIGLRNGPGQGDRAQRLPMRWNSQPGFGFTPPQDLDDRADVSSPRANVSVAAQVNDPDSLLSHYRRLIQLRVKSPALSGGATRILRSKSSGGSVLAVLRERGRSRVLIIANISIEPARRIEVFGAQNEGQRDLYPGLPPFGAEIIPL